MTGKTQAARQPSIDELLTSIREAIHERVKPGASARAPVAEHARPAAVPEAGFEAKFMAGPEAGTEAAGTKRTIVTRGREGFAGLLGGDVRLEEALARLNQPAWPRAANAPVAANAAHSEMAAPSAPEPRFRPTIDEGGDAKSADAKSAGAKSPDARSADEGRKEGRLHQAPGGLSRLTDRPARLPGGPTQGELLSLQAASAANSAFSQLNDATVPRSARTERPLDEMTRDCLRPLLKAWLDENLPGMVERLVREEIARVARRGS